tara:strand:+ start:1041 stop:1535 length:495 start_codon:yes stop_codon:yes gene_type:complete
MIFNSKSIEDIRNRQITLVKGFSLDEFYDMNKLTTFIDNYSMDIMCSTGHDNFFKQVLLIKYINQFDQNVTIIQDFLQKTFKYKSHEKNGADIFFSLAANIGLSHVDKEDVFLIGSYGKTTYKIIPDGIDYEIGKGDLLYIPRGTRHRSFSSAPRAVISIGFFE